MCQFVLNIYVPQNILEYVKTLKTPISRSLFLIMEI